MSTALVTALYAALLTPLFLVLSARVIRNRRLSGITIGVADHASLERAARVHANFAEYVPLALLLMLLVELSSYRSWLVHVLGVLLLVGRYVHAWGVSQPVEDYRLRVTGVVLTITVLAVSALLLFIAAVARIV